MAAILILLFLTGCTTMADWFSGPVRSPASTPVYPVHLDHLTIGVTTQAQVRATYGAPTDLQTSVRNGGIRETWAYANASPAINPLQYLPLVGVLALTRHPEYPTFSVSFAPNGIVDGVSIREAQPYGDVTSNADRNKTGYAVIPYGLNNPMIHALPGKPPARAKSFVP